MKKLKNEILFALEPVSTAKEWNRRILVVDDEKEIAQSYIDILASSDSPGRILPIRSSRLSPEAATSGMKSEYFDVVKAHSAEDAIQIIKESIAASKPFAMGFFDVMLGPGKDGIELVKEVQALDPEIYAVFVTAYSDRSVDSIREFLGRESVNRWDYLTKPFVKGEILQKARNLTALWNLHREQRFHENQLNELRRRLSDAEKSSSVAAISRGVSHEFGNILMQIMGKADISRHKSEIEMRKALEVILDASQRASRILDKFKNIASGKLEEKLKEKVSLSHVLDKALDLMEFQLRANGITVQQSHMSAVEVPIMVTPILQVIVNLTINAIHAIGKNGQIDYSITQTKEFAELIVHDSGPGVPEEIIEKVTEPFFTTKGPLGSGLGLAICKEIVEIDHGGEFVLRNHRVNGLEVVVRLPLVDPTEEKHESR